ncbi:MAG: hypothetical protein CM1200mP1_11690 [Candidatus Neomarinimicrobiota bacterium]|nr:MAG: hypothetical protein CM1200mP1_11690 [Candidatus Neomarinimicrobiota bacterium]
MYLMKLNPIKKKILYILVSVKIFRNMQNGCGRLIFSLTNNQDFFGGSVVEAIYCGVYPVLPKRLTIRGFTKKYYDNHIYKNDGELYDKKKNCMFKIDETGKLGLEKRSKNNWGLGKNRVGPHNYFIF